MTKRVSMDDWVTEHMADIAAEELRNEDSPHFEALMEAAAKVIAKPGFNAGKILKSMQELDIDFHEVPEEQYVAAVRAAVKKAQAEADE